MEVGGACSPARRREELLENFEPKEQQAAQKFRSESESENV